MKTSEEGLQFIMEQEGCILHPYKDQTGHLTIGVGHLVQPGEHFPAQISREDAMELLAKDVARFERAVNSYDLDLTQSQFDVLVDFSFNCGEGALKQLLSHGFDEVPNQLPRWNKSSGQVVGALTRRRRAEIQMWEA